MIEDYLYQKLLSAFENEQFPEITDDESSPFEKMEKYEFIDKQRVSCLFFVTRDRLLLGISRARSNRRINVKGLTFLDEFELSIKECQNREQLVRCMYRSLEFHKYICK